MGRAKWKQCRTCERSLTVDNFHKDKSRSDGLTYTCKVCNRAMRKAYYSVNVDKVKETNETYRLSNMDKVREAHRRHRRDKYYSDPIFRLHCCVSSRMRDSLKGSNKQNKTWTAVVGYDAQELKTHLESLFTEGMSWDNYGKWHVDHKRPLCSFSAGDVREAWSLENLQPLWADENIRKGGSYVQTEMGD